MFRIFNQQEGPNDRQFTVEHLRVIRTKLLIAAAGGMLFGSANILANQDVVGSFIISLGGSAAFNKILDPYIFNADLSSTTRTVLIESLMGGIAFNTIFNLPPSLAIAGANVCLAAATELVAILIEHNILLRPN